MEQSKQSAQSAVNPNGKTIKVKVQEYYSKDVTNDYENVSFMPDNFAHFIGGLIDPANKEVAIVEKKNKISFKVNDGTTNGLIIEIPSETANNDRLQRIIKAVQNTSKQIFAGYMLEEETKNETHRAMLSSLSKAGIKFSTFTKIAVNKGLRAWAENKRLKVAILIEKSKVDNLRMIAENEVMRPEVKKLQDVTKSEMIKILPETTTKLQLFLSK